MTKYHYNVAHLLAGEIVIGIVKDWLVIEYPSSNVFTLRLGDIWVSGGLFDGSAPEPIVVRGPKWDGIKPRVFEGVETINEMFYKLRADIPDGVPIEDRDRQYKVHFTQWVHYGR